MERSANPDSGGLTRRQVMQGAAALALATSAMPGAAAASPAAGPMPAMPPGMLAASSRLTGIALDRSYLEIASTVWTAMVERQGATAMTALVEALASRPGQPPPTQDLLAAGLMPAAQALAETWYTGTADGGQTVLFYDQALMWRSCAFTKPPANCGGPFGYWSEAPSS
jgi:hypothetical protein